MNIRLVPYRRDYLEGYLRYREQASTVRHNPLTPSTVEELERRLEKEGSELSDLKRFESYRWFVEAEGEIVGNVSLTNINHMMGYAEIGYGISEPGQGRGIGTEAVRLLVRKVFAESPMRKIIAYVHDQNIPSCRVLERLGFRREGLLREHYIINGKPENESLYGILRDEWQA
jgi:ribosomal-protein-alanine N-acetyltransferase